MEKDRQALNYTFFLLKYRDYTEKELTAKLKQKKYNSDIIDKILKKLKEFGLVDDKKFTLNWISKRLASGRGLHLIKRELYEKGVKEETIQECVEEMKQNPEDEMLSARKIFDKKIERVKGEFKGKRLPLDKIYRSVGGYLARRGYSVSTINKIFKEWNSEYSSLIDSDF